MTSSRSTQQGALGKSLGLMRLSLYGIGTIVGAGIYSVIGPVADAAGQDIWLSFLIAAGISALSGLSYAELASALPSAAAEHNFLRKALPNFPALAFVTGLFIAIHGAATFATVALTFGSYLQSFVDGNPTVVALVLMVLATAINVSGIKRASIVTSFLTVAQIAILLAFAGTAFFSTGATVPAKISYPTAWSGILQGAAIAFFIYSGYEHMASLSEEARNPKRDIWRAFMIALAATTLIYMLVVFSVLALSNVRDLAGSDFPLAQSAGTIGQWFAATIAVAALIATANAVLSSSISGSRLLFGMARSGDLPKILETTIGHGKSPWLAALVILAIASIFALLGEIKFVASLSSLGVLLVFTAVNVAVIVLRYAKPELERPFRVPSVGQFPVTAALGGLFSLLLSAQYDLAVYLTFILGCMGGLVPYAFIRQRSR